MEEPWVPVETAPPMDWSRNLQQSGDEETHRLTRNVLLHNSEDATQPPAPWKTTALVHAAPPVALAAHTGAP